MAQLISCAECGNSVSSEAYICPHCQKNPRSYTCMLCDKLGRMSDGSGVAVTIDNSSAMVHAECLKLLLSKDSGTITFTCSLCAYTSSYEDVECTKDSDGYNQYKKICPKCGHPFQFYQCVFCRKPIVSHCVQTIGHYRYGNHSTHKCCSQIIKEQRIKGGVCERCGLIYKPGLLDALIGQTCCKSCR